MRDDLRPSKILAREAFENAIVAASTLALVQTGDEMRIEQMNRAVDTLVLKGEAADEDSAVAGRPCLDSAVKFQRIAQAWGTLRGSHWAGDKH